MNIRAVLRTYGMLRSLTSDESALLETLRKFTDAEREAFVEALGPQKKVTKPRNRKGGGSKSSRASGMAAQLNKTLQSQREQTPSYCRHVTDDNGGELICGEYADANMHHLTTDVNYHPFVATEPPAANAAGGD